MKTYFELKEKQKRSDADYDVLKRNNPESEELAILGDWIDFLDDYLYWNMISYGKENGIDFDSDNAFEFTEEEEKNFVITELQAKERLDAIGKELKINHQLSNDLNRMLQTEYNILKWILE